MSSLRKEEMASESEGYSSRRMMIVGEGKDGTQSGSEGDRTGERDNQGEDKEDNDTSNSGKEREETEDRDSAHREPTGHPKVTSAKPDHLHRDRRSNTGAMEDIDDNDGEGDAAQDKPQPPDGGFGWLVVLASFIITVRMALVVTFTVAFTRSGQVLRRLQGLARLCETWQRCVC